MAVFLGCAVRLGSVVLADFPLNDGGMISVLVKEIVENHYRLPVYTSYNGGLIPFTYPPLAFYLAAMISQVVRIPVEVVLQYLPAGISILIIPAVYSFAYTLSKSQRQAALAAFCYALAPRSFIWLIMGGGVSRALGVLWAVLALDQIVKLFQQAGIGRQTLWTLGRVILFSSLTILTHPEIAWFVFCTTALFFIHSGITWPKMQAALVVSIGVVFLTAFWWAPMLLQHGITPWLAALQVENERATAILRLLLFYFTGEPYTALISSFAILGILVGFINRQRLVIAWLVTAVLISYRNEAYLLVIPVSMLASQGLDQVVFPGLHRLIHQHRQPDETIMGDYLSNRTLQVAFGLMAAYAFISAFTVQYLEQSGLRSLPLAERKAMAWAVESTPPGSQFVVLTGEQNWEVDRASEWFPALAQRTSLATVQGTEWLANNRYAAVTDAYHSLQNCVTYNVDCLQDWAEQNHSVFSHVYINRLESNLGRALLQSQAYKVIYQAEGVAILEKEW